MYSSSSRGCNFRSISTLLLVSMVFGCGSSGDDEESTGESTVSGLNYTPIVIDASSQDSVLDDYTNAGSGLSASSDTAIDANSSNDLAEATFNSIAKISKRYNPKALSEQAKNFSGSREESLAENFNCLISGSSSISIDFSTFDTAISFNNCSDIEGIVLNGDLSFRNENQNALTILSNHCDGVDNFFTIEATNYSATFSDSEISSVDMSGDMEYCFSMESEESYEAYTGADGLQMVVDSNRMQFDNYIDHITVPGDNTYQYSVSGTVQSEELAASYTLSTPVTLTGEMEDYQGVPITGAPTAGTLRFTGAENATIDVVVDATSLVTIETDENGDGTVDSITAPMAWDDLSWNDIF